MKAGFHGTTGLTNACLKRMIDLYIIPRLLYGLESLIVTEKQKTLLETAYRDLLKRIQALPQRTANEAPYLLFHSTTAEGTLDIRTLTFFGKIINDSSSILHQICIRQLATKELSSNSWFISIVKLTFKYGLPSPHDVIQNPMKYNTWKRLVKKTVHMFWKEELETAAKEKPTLQLIHQEIPSWEHVEMNPYAVDRARLQARILTETFTLQKHRAKFYKESPNCRLCLLEPEDSAHMLLRCPALQLTRCSALLPVYQRIQDIGNQPPRSENELLEILLGFSRDAGIYKLASNACYAITHLRQSLYSNQV